MGDAARASAEWRRTVPIPWRALISEVNGGRIPDGEPGVRDVDAPCDVFEPGESGHGPCETDGHYLCVECVHIDLATLRRRRDQCEDCGAKLERVRTGYGPEDVCSARCDAPTVPV